MADNPLSSTGKSLLNATSRTAGSAGSGSNNLKRTMDLASLAHGDVIAAKSPGPIYSPRVGALGPQPISTLRSPKAVVFGTAPKMPVAPELDGPGPGTYPLDNSWAKGRKVPMLGRTKFGSEVVGDPSIPGPGAYNRPNLDAVNKPAAPKISIKGRRPVMPPSTLVPAANLYQKPEPFNAKQAMSTVQNPPAVKFGEAPRKSVKETSARLFSSPGPLDYYPDKGLKHVSTLPATMAVSLRSRRPDPNTTRSLRVVPNFHDPVPAMGKQPLSERKSAPAVSLAGRTKFGSVY